MKTLGIVLLVTVIITAAFLFGGLIWMLCLNALSIVFNAPNLSIGYWPSVLVGIIFAILFGGAKASRSKN